MNSFQSSQRNPLGLVVILIAAIGLTACDNSQSGEPKGGADEGTPKAHSHETSGRKATAFALCFVDDRVHQRSNARDLHLDNIAGDEPALRIAFRADARRGARADDVARV